jgi:phenylalanyl-tRNA synthetase alpha chain
MNNLDHILKEAQKDFDQCQSLTDLDQAKAKYLGKNGVLTDALKSLGKLSAEERHKVGAEINVVKQGVEEALEKKRQAILNESQAKQLAEESLDVTLPSRKEERGSLQGSLFSYRCRCLQPCSLLQCMGKNRLLLH